MAAALRQKAPVVVLHLTRPPIVVPDRPALGMASHFDAAQGAYIVRDYKPGKPKGGTLIVQGTSSMVGITKILTDLDQRGLNVKIVYGASPELFALQPESYRSQILSAGDRMDSTVVTTQSRASMHEWLFNKVAEDYAMSSDWDNRWRTGGTVDEVLEEAHLSPEWILKGIERFVTERPKRLERLQAGIDQART
jgi:transketolase